MLDLFTIFTKGGMVLWYFQGTAFSMAQAVNGLVKAVILQERVGVNSYTHDSLTLKFRLDNEFDLVFVAVYQKMIQLAYVDKLLEQVQLAFRDRYKNELANGACLALDFSREFNGILDELESEQRSQEPRKMRTFNESKKADKIQQQPNVDVIPEKPTLPQEEKTPPVAMVEEAGAEPKAKPKPPVGPVARTAAGMRKAANKRTSSSTVAKQSSVTTSPKSRSKEKRVWEGVVTKEEASSLDRSSTKGGNGCIEVPEYQVDYSMVGQMKGDLKSLEEEEVESEVESEEEETTSESKQNTSKNSGGVFSFFMNLAGGKTITQDSMTPILEKMKEHLITKNVAAEIAEKLCTSVAGKLDGKVVGTFTGIQSTVRASLEESLVQILSPKRRVDILRDVMVKREGGSQPYVITFCGVNGVGKSTNLAKVAFWLLENGHRVLIAACDTFRSGAVEQLRTHTHHLDSLHKPAREGAPPSIMLYERGYGKDASGIAMEAIGFAQQQGFDVVLVDTAGRMQDNEPLMRALAKLIRVNNPDLVLFVGEALVGNEAVDQLTKFNRALVDHSDGDNQRVVDGIVLTKFDTIDDKVGAAISMTYTTGQPIVFVGTGQKYVDLKSLNVHAVVSALLK